MNTARIDQILSLMKPDELQDALWLIGVLERWRMPSDQADEWRRRVLAYQCFRALSHEPHTH